jgi:hypothetical protein
LIADPSRQRRRGNFGIKSFLFQNWGHVFTPNFGEGYRDSKPPRLHRQGIDLMRIGISRFGFDIEIDYFIR